MLVISFAVPTVLRELQAVADSVPDGQWCWATQAADSITGMRRLVAEAITRGRDAVDPAALAVQVTRYRSAALIGASQTSARKGKLMKKHNALARRLAGRQDDYDGKAEAESIRLPAHNGRSPAVLRDPKQYLSTAAKHGLTFYDALVMLTEAQPWMPATA